MTDAADHRFEIDALIRGSVHVWHLELDPTGPQFSRWEPWLGPEDRTRAAAFTREPARRRFVIAHGLLRLLLGRYLGVSPHSLGFESGTHGKPRLAGTEPDRGLVFNVSHSGDCIAIALAHDARLGVDIEGCRPIKELGALAARCLGPSELTHWRGLPETQQLGTFFRLWTLKEAFCKAVGRGIGLGLRECVFDCAEIPARLLSWPSAAGEANSGDWLFAEFGRSARLRGAVAIDRPTGSVQHFDFPEQSLQTPPTQPLEGACPPFLW